jgi:hypothetical protein
MVLEYKACMIIILGMFNDYSISNIINDPKRDF